MADIFLRAGAASPSDIVLRDPTLPDGGEADQAEGAAVGIAITAAGAYEQIAGAAVGVASAAATTREIEAGTALGVASASASARERIAGSTTALASGTAGARERVAAASVGVGSGTAGARERIAAAAIGLATATSSPRELVAGSAVGAATTVGGGTEEHAGAAAVGIASASGGARELISGTAVGAAGGTGIWSFVHIARGGWISDEDIEKIKRLFEREGRIRAFAKPGVSAGRGSVIQPSQPAREMPNIVNVAWGRSGGMTATGAVPTAFGSGSVLVSDEDMELVGALAGIDDEEWWT